MVSRRLSKLITCLSLILLGLAGGFLVARSRIAPEDLSRQIATPVQAAGRVSTGNASALPVSTAVKATNGVTSVVQKVSPSVVTVGAVKRTLVAQPWFDNYLFPSYRYAQASQRIPYMGSGFLVDDLGHIVTNFHVIDDSESLFVTLSNGHEYPAELVDADRYADLALLKIASKDGEALPPALQFADSDTAQIGEQVVALGNPFGNLIEDSRPTATVGYISAMHRSFRPDRENMRVYQDMIQTDASINPGNSGGPLVDINGDVLGVNSFIFSPSGGNTGVSFAIPSNRVRGLVDEIRQYGRLRPLLLDFAFRTIRTPRLSGVQVFDVRGGGPAQDAGIQVGDVIVAADGRPVESREEFYLVFASRQVGDQVTLKAWRNGQLVESVYTVKEAAK